MALTCEKIKEKKFTKHLTKFVNKVDPSQILPYLQCLTKDSKQEITAAQQNKGQRHAVQVLYMHLIRMSEWWVDLEEALRDPDVNQPQLADLLDLQQDQQENVNIYTDRQFSEQKKNEPVTAYTPFKHLNVSVLETLTKLDHEGITDWRRLAGILDYTCEQVNKIESTRDGSYTRHLLNDWKTKSGANLGTLMQALEIMEREDLICDIEKITGYAHPRTRYNENDELDENVNQECCNTTIPETGNEVHETAQSQQESWNPSIPQTGNEAHDEAAESQKTWHPKIHETENEAHDNSAASQQELLDSKIPQMKNQNDETMLDRNNNIEDTQKQIFHHNTEEFEPDINSEDYRDLGDSHKSPPSSTVLVSDERENDEKVQFPVQEVHQICDTQTTYETGGFDTSNVGSGNSVEIENARIPGHSHNQESENVEDTDLASSQVGDDKYSAVEVQSDCNISFAADEIDQSEIGKVFSSSTNDDTLVQSKDGNSLVDFKPDTGKPCSRFFETSHLQSLSFDMKEKNLQDNLEAQENLPCENSQFLTVNGELVPTNDNEQGPCVNTLEREITPSICDPQRSESNTARNNNVILTGSLESVENNENQTFISLTDEKFNLDKNHDYNKTLTDKVIDKINNNSGNFYYKGSAVIGTCIAGVSLIAFFVAKKL